MPRLSGENMVTTNIGNNFTFSAIKTEHLGASEYTLVNISVDITGSVAGFAKELKQCLVAAVESCRKSPRADNLLVRVVLFHSSLPNGGLEEVHGFKPLSEIDTNDYQDLMCAGATNLYDAAYAMVGTSHEYAKQLTKDEFNNNIINIIITDGEDNRSTLTPAAVKRAIAEVLKSEDTESCINILVGVNDSMCQGYLDNFKNEGGFDTYIPAGDVTPAKLAKLANFISQSISSQSQSLGTGGPSKNIAATI
jgi:uncharacterized protein YegL